MNIIMMLLLPLLVVALLATPFVPIYRGVTTGKKAKHSLIANICVFAGICLVAIAVPLSGGVAAAAGGAASSADGLGYLSAALVTSVSCIGAAIALAAGVPAAVGAISEDPKSFGKALIFVVLGEGIAIYGLLISILILGHLG